MKRISFSAILCTAAAIVLVLLAAFSFAEYKGPLDKAFKEFTNISQNTVSHFDVNNGTSGIASDEEPISAVGEVRTVKKITEGVSGSSEDEKNVTVTSRSMSAGKYTPVKQNYCYQGLNSEPARSIYRLISDNVNWISGRKSDSGYYPIRTISYAGDATEAQIRLGMLAYLDDNPAVFWVAGVYGFSKHNGATSIQLFSVLPPDECIAMEKSLNSTVYDVVSSIPSGLSEFAREEYLFNYISSHCTYDSMAIQNSGNWQAFSACGALINGKAVCEGYSRAVQLLAGCVGISCTLVYGQHDGVGHMWNEIQINDCWYHLDLTWCDNSIIIYNYFNVTDSVIRKTHQISPTFSELSEDEIKNESVSFNFVLHDCSSIRDNYFQRCGIPVSSAENFKDKTVINQLTPLIKAGKTTAVFLIQDNFDETVQKMASGKLSKWLLQASLAAGENVKSVEVKYLPDPDNSGVTATFSFN